MLYIPDEEELTEDVSELTIYEQAVSHPPRGWEDVFEDCLDELKIISEIVYKGGSYYPEQKQVFRAFRMLPLENVRVVIIGESPYPGRGNACGLSFSSEKSIPASLKNVFKELEREYDNFTIPKTGDLTDWVLQGVLLLNSCLTYSVHDERLNKRSYWNPFVMKVIKAICTINPHTIFVLWGNHALKYKERITSPNILTGPHPSPNTWGFVGCGHFTQINDILEKIDQPQIDWRL